MSIESFTFSSLNPGKHLLVIGAVHGDEPCGTEAIKHMIKNLENGNLNLVSGTVSFIPIANPKAYKRNIRYYESNLNRRLFRKENPKTYEDQLGEIICGYLERADVVLDIHSYQAQGGPFCFLGRSSQAEIDYCLSLRLDHYVYGWTEAFAPLNFDSLNNDEKEHYRKQAMGTTEYARTHGAIACTVECGQHRNTNNSEIAYKCMLRAMEHCKILNEKNTKNQLHTKPEFYQMHTACFKEQAGVYAQSWQHLQPLKKGDLIASYEDGRELRADIDGAIILPNPLARHEEKEEWFYLASSQPVPKPIQSDRSDN